MNDPACALTTNMEVDHKRLCRLGGDLALVAPLVPLLHVPDGQDEAAAVLEGPGRNPLV